MPDLSGIFRSDKALEHRHLHREFSSLHNGSSSGADSNSSPVSDTTNQACTRIKDVRPVVDEVCRILGSGYWGHDIEDGLSSLDQIHQPELVNGVLKRLENVKLAMNYFRWVEKKTGQVHNGGAYEALLMEVGYEVNVPLFTTVICAVARDGRVDAALSLLVGKVDIAWKFFHEIKHKARA
ncbi:hypothetical protein C5167_043367 [Papaver somniferum]|uniref:Uncharacterized protein n=1 Tax=Papaver somniferum TaxID=3469 RepID=A0A4Y7L8J0_PAPSO|nr:hypothetical protein C5167_043367 [Papaver somniferum]